MTARAVRQDTFIYKHAAGCDIRADAYWTPGAPPGPAVLWLHGGGLVTGSRRALPAEQAALYVSAGFTVVAADYRLAPETRLPAIMEDASDALAWLRGGEHGLPIDPDRIAVIGHSAGGYLALRFGLEYSVAPRAIVSFYGYGDIAGDWCALPAPYYQRQPAIPAADALRAVGGAPLSEVDSPERLRFYIYCRQSGTWLAHVTGLDLAHDAAAIHTWCPARQAVMGFPPSLLIHGEADTDVPAAQSQLMAQALSAAGVPHDLLILPGRGHGFDLEAPGLGGADTMRAFARVIAFLQQHTAPG